VGSYPGKVEISTPNATQTKLMIPKDAVPGQTIHLILQATDDGRPPLTAYQRVIITVRGK